MNIHTLDLGFRHLDHTIAAFVLEGPGGLALVETGPYSAFPQMVAALAANGWKPADFRHVFLSHIHFDHAGAAWAFAREGATVHVHPKGLPHLAAPDKLYNSARMIYGDEMDSLWGAMEPIPEAQLRAPEHGEVVEAAGLHFTAWYTPGHAVHHIAWEVSAPGDEPVVFTGDVAGVRIDPRYLAPPCPPPDIHLEDWQASLQLLRDLPAEVLFLTHFGKITAKQTHLDELESRLLTWAAWMKPYAERQTPAAEVVPAFEAYVHAELVAAGVSPENLARYEVANPAFMSVAGLLRYWKKNLTA
ncbi:MAG: MBL fold metallo-hydrolase [Saprospiraceae bacterium]